MARPSDEDTRWSIGRDYAGGVSIEELYREHADWLRRRLTRCLRVQPADMEDIVQDTWLRASSPKPGAIAHPKAFLSQVALNLFRDGKRREAVRDAHSRATIMAFTGDAQPGGLAEQEAIVELERIVLDMPEKFRDVFLLSRFQHMTNAEIAEHLGISIKTVEWRMGKALALCMSKLRD